MIEDLKQRLMAPAEDISVEGQQNREKAAVLLAIQVQPEPALVLTQRASTLNSHGGEVAWPGGKHDPLDGSLETTVLRETWEEIGLPPEKVNIVAELRPFISKFGLVVTPYVGFVDEPVRLKANPEELESIFMVPLAWLKNDPRSQTDVITRYGETHHIPVYHYEENKIWGLTAMILWEFVVRGMAVDSSKSAYGKLQNTLLTNSVNSSWEKE